MSGRYYGQYRFRLTREVFGSVEPRRPEFVAGAAEQIYDRAVNSLGLSPGNVYPVQVGLIAENRVVSGEASHIFLGPESEEVVRRSVGKLVPEDLEVVELTESLSGVVYTTSGEPVLFSLVDGDLGSLVINIESLGAFAPETWRDWFDMEPVDPSHVNVATTDGTLTADKVEGAVEQIAVIKKAGRLVLGVIFMHQVMPEIFLDGPPERIKHPAWYRRLPNKVTMELNPGGRTVCPHIRSGYFVVYRHERYKNVRGQVRFIKPTMVKGGAVHTRDAL